MNITTDVFFFLIIAETHTQRVVGIVKHNVLGYESTLLFDFLFSYFDFLFSFTILVTVVMNMAHKRYHAQFPWTIQWTKSR